MLRCRERADDYRDSVFLLFRDRRVRTRGTFATGVRHIILTVPRDHDVAVGHWVYAIRSRVTCARRGSIVVRVRTSRSPRSPRLSTSDGAAVCVCALRIYSFASSTDRPRDVSSSYINIIVIMITSPPRSTTDRSKVISTAGRLRVVNDTILPFAAAYRFCASLKTACTRQTPKTVPSLFRRHAGSTVRGGEIF